MRNWARSRRDLLRRLGLGAAALPILNATRPLRAAPLFPRRAILVVQTNGLSANAWKPTGTGTDLTQRPLPAITAPLEPYRADISVIAEVSNPGYTGAGHGAYGTVLCPGPNAATGEYWTPRVATLDQVCGDAVAKTANVPFRTLPLQVQVDRTGERRLGAYRCFFRGEAQPVTPEASPYKVAERLFAGKPTGDPTIDRLRAERRSLLDFVATDLQRFARNLGQEDRRNVDGYLTSIREVEKQLAAPAPAAGTCTAPNLGQPLAFDSNENYPKTLALQLDLAVAALRCDATRVVTIQLSQAHGDGYTFPWIGITGRGLEIGGASRTWHDIGHREVRDGVNEKVKVDSWFMQQLAGLLRRLKEAPEGGGSMLDNTVVLWANHMQYGGNHNAQRLPWIMAGKCGGYFKTGQYLALDGTAKQRIMIHIANALGANLPSYGGAEHTPLAGLGA